MPKETVYLDPSNEFMARSIDSYLNKKTIIEFHINMAKFDNLDLAQDKLLTDNVSFRIKINVGDYFWTSTPFVEPEVRPDSTYVDFNEKFKLRVPMGDVDKIVVSLWGSPTENHSLDDEFQALKTELNFGSTIVRLDKEIPTEASVAWVPLNNGVCFEELTMSKDDAILSLSFRLIENAPGNSPEAIMSGKNFIIGEMVYYNEPVELRYPTSRNEFLLLGRKDIKYDPDRAGTLGSPLRYPMNEEEWSIAKLECKLLD